MGRITLIAHLQSNIQAGLKAIGGAATNLGNVINGMGMKANVAMGNIGKLGNALNAAHMAANAAAAAMAKATAAQHQHGISTTRLIVMMVKFGIILNALRVVTAPLGWMAEGVKTSIQLDRGLRNIVGMLANVGETSQQLDVRFRRLLLDATAIQTRYGQTTEATVEGLYKISSVADTLNFNGVRDVVDRVNYSIDYLGNIASRAAVAGMTDFSTAADAMTSVLNGLNIPMIQAAEVSDILFQTVRLGKAEFKDAAKDMGVLAGAFSAITKQGQEMQMLQESGGLYAFFSTFLPPDEARVSLQRMGLFLTGESKAGQDLVEKIRELSGGTVKMRAGDVKEQGLMTTFKQLAGFMDPNNPLLRAGVEETAGRSVTEQELEGVRFRLLTTIFDDARAARAALRVLGTDGTASLDKITDAMLGFDGATDRALGEGEKSIQFRIDKLRETIVATARSLSESALPGMGDVFYGISERLRMLMLRPAYMNSSFGGKIGFIFGDMYQAFTQWYQAGGKAQLAQVAGDMGKDMGNFIMGVLGLNIQKGANEDEYKNAWYDAGTTAAGEWLKGFLNAINPFGGPPGSNPIDNLMSRNLFSGPMKFASTAFLAKSMGAPLPLALGAGLVTGGQDEGLGGILAGAVELIGLYTAYRLGAKGLSTMKGNFMAKNPMVAAFGSLKASAGYKTPGGNPFAKIPGASTLGRWAGLGGVGSKILPGVSLVAPMVNDMNNGEDLMYSIAHGLIVGGMTIAGGSIGGLLGIPSGPGLVATSVIGGIAGNKAGESFFNAEIASRFSRNRNAGLAAGAELPGSVIQDYFDSRQAMAEGQMGPSTIIINVEKIADTVTAATPEEAEKMADSFLERVALKLDKATNNTGRNGGAAPVISTGGGGSW